MNKDLYDDWIRHLGEEYPAAIQVGGTRIALDHETRFKRHYIETTPEAEHHIDVSRFIDGTASITLTQIKAEWSTWNEANRIDFCDSILDLVNVGQQDLAEILRFLIQNAEVNLLGQVVLQLPRLQMFSPEETFNLLFSVLRRSTLGHTANVIVALGLTKHPEAESTIRGHLQNLVADPATWANAILYNHLAIDASHCIFGLLKLSASPAQFDQIVHRLCEHACERNRLSSRRNFAKYYAWLGG